jgi:hypothetical protein
MIASAAMSLSSVSVIGNALRLRRMEREVSAYELFREFGVAAST